ncbi:MAG: hypothetical protein AAF298_08210, partial [Cyanobacteria bacterium P01_A01_bin.40]
PYKINLSSVLLFSYKRDRGKALKIKPLRSKGYREMWHDFTRISVEPRVEILVWELFLLDLLH